ncbi:MAG: single-stranded DNA-binding protein [Patescibacteria group bacterium]|nr:single-stranded DNA-binding protein [Patescibacteria group bacterium]
MDLNKSMFIGNITNDLEMRTTPNGQNVTNFSIATNRRWKNQNTGEMQEEAQFHRIVAWGKLAEICSQYMTKGMRVYIEGRLTHRSWDDQQTGQKRYMTEIVAENAIMLDRKGSGGAGAPSTDAQIVTPAAPAAAASSNQDNVSIPSPDQIPTINVDEDKEEIKVEDIPF